MRFEQLEEYGIDWRSGLTRCMNNQAFYARMLSMFLQDQALSSAEAACRDKDYSTMFEHMHDLKGACANVGMTRLASAASPLVETLRSAAPSEKDVESQLEQVRSAYASARAGIERLLADSAAEP